MNAATPEARVPEIFRRYVAAAPEDFVTRTDAMRDLEDVVEAIAWDALDAEGALDRWTSTDGVAEMVQTADRKFDCQGELWMLGPDSWAVPLHATFQLSEDLNSVTSYEVRIGDTSREARQARSGRRDPQEWATVVSR